MLINPVHNLYLFEIEGQITELVHGNHGLMKINAINLYFQASKDENHALMGILISRKYYELMVFLNLVLYAQKKTSRWTFMHESAKINIT